PVLISGILTRQFKRFDEAPEARRPGIRTGFAGDHVHHCGFAGAIGTNDAAQLARLHGQSKFVKRLEAVEADRHVVEIEHLVSNGHLFLPADRNRPATPRGRNTVTNTNSAPRAYSQTSGNAPVK